jgi:hypothetical protein
VSNRQGIGYDANAPVVLTSGQLLFNGSTYDVAASVAAAQALTAAASATSTAAAAQATANAALPSSGGTMTGDINMGGTHRVTNMASPSASTDATNKSYVDNLVTGVMRFKGSTDCRTNPNYPSAVKGDAYVVSGAGKIGGSAGLTVEVGDVYVAIADNAGGTQASVGSSWDVLQYNLVGALLSANNLSDVSNVATARTNLGLGTAATTASTDYATAAQGTLASGAAQKANNLSDLASVATARTNLGLGTAATYAATAFATAAQGTAADGSAQKANNLSDLASASTARTNIGLGNVDNTSDVNKPVSTAQAAAIALKAPIANANFTGRIGIENTPSARLHLPAGNSGAGFSPFKLTTGTNLATPEDGAMEYDGTNLYFTVGSSRKTLTASASVWSFDSAYDSAGTGTSQYFNVATLAVNDVLEIEVNVRAAVTSAALNTEMVQVRARATCRRPGTSTYATQILSATTDKQTTTNVAGFFVGIEEDGTTKGKINVRVTGVAGYQLVGRVFGWTK